MAHKAQSFKVEKKTIKKRQNKKTISTEVNVIILYTNVEPSPAEQMLINRYLDMGYEPMFEEKKTSLSVAEMRDELKNDADAKAKFEEAYKQKNGFFKACKVYSEWKKNSKKPADTAQENADENANKKADENADE